MTIRIPRPALTLPLGGAGALVVMAAGYFTIGPLTRDPLVVRPGTTHPTLSRESCLTCHGSIAEEWRQSLHARSATTPGWERVRADGFDGVYRALRVPCMPCHAPANVLDLAAGAYPQERSDAPDLGVDCVSCHVSERGIVGPGRSTDAPHEVIADARFADSALTSTALCGRCHEGPADHSKTVTAWQHTPFAARGVTCLDCHMARVAPAGPAGEGPPHRSHRFLGDSDDRMLHDALNATIELTADRRAILHITNDRVGHALPGCGMNWLVARLEARGTSGETLEHAERGFGTREWIPGYVDFWPFLQITKIPYGESRELAFTLPPGHGTVSARFRYRNWLTGEERSLGAVAAERSY